ncbi:DNA polymerase [Caudoviricetes sp.]|nr:DNA polymerase [Caudoviricetes sp.]UOF79644.1 DNA polymerase [Caudoviricetes sp.]UOF79832.1 DNA polymerase [Bacteriophage sp.]UOF81315.1 DNA polymerase [Caudoviricetes sp.]
MYGDGQGFVPDALVSGSHTFVVLQNPGEQEETEGVPAIGPSGDYLNTTFLPLAGLTRAETSVGNVLKCRWTNPKTGCKTNQLPSVTGANNEAGDLTLKSGRWVLNEAIRHCMQAHFVIPDEVTHLVALGDVAWQTLSGGVGNIDDWRGFLAPNTYRGRAVFGTFHPAYLFHQPRLSIPVMRDWKRLKAIGDGHWPTPIPQARRALHLTEMPYVPQTEYISLDLEYGQHITLLGMAYFDEDMNCLDGIQVPGKSLYDHDAITVLRGLAKSYRFIIFNAVADLEQLERELGIHPDEFMEILDPIQLHNLHHSEWPHDLGFCESLYGRHNRMKHLQDTDFYLYNWGDCLTSAYTFAALNISGPISTIYHTQNKPLIPIRTLAKVRGIALDQTFLAKLANDLGKTVELATTFAESFGGLNIGSHKQITEYLTKVEKLKLPRSRETGAYKIDKDVLADLRRKFLDYDPDEERHGMTIEQFEQNVADGGHPLLEARALFQGAAQLKNHFINTLLKPGVDQNKTVYDPDDFVPRCFPNQHTHTQASGRWSTTEPPLPTLPERLRKMVLPDPGYAIVKFDWDQEELRINAHLAKDLPTLEWFAEHYDIHTLNTCDIFAWTYPTDKRDPHGSAECQGWRTTQAWEGKVDKRRTFSKRFVYRIIYRGNPAHAGDIPGAKVLGLTRQSLAAASNSYIARHPALKTYWRHVDSAILKTRTAYTFTGRRRFLNGESTKAGAGDVPPICREGTNHPMQGGGVDVFNLTLLAIYQVTRDLDAQWLYGAHDSQNWMVPEQHVAEFKGRVQDVTLRPWQVEGRPLSLPVTIE